MPIGFSNPSVAINNVPVAIIPNSFKFNDGGGEIKVRAMSAGGGSITTVHTEDATTKMGKFSFELAVTAANRSLALTWKSNIGANVCMAIDPNLPPIVMQNMSMTNDPEWDASADGKAKIEFSGDPAFNN